MTIDNLVVIDRIKEVSGTDGHPSVLTVRSNGTDAAEALLERLFVNDTVSFLRADWRVWDIDGNEITLVRVEN